MFIYLPHYAGYEVRYNIEADCLEVRRLYEVEMVTDESDDGYRSGGTTLTRMEGKGEWREDHDFCEELLQEGRGRYAQLQAAAAAMAAEKAAMAAEKAARKLMTVEVVDGQLFIDGERIAVDRLCREAFEETEMAVVRWEYPGCRLAENVEQTWIGEPWESASVVAYNTRDGVVVIFGYED